MKPLYIALSEEPDYRDELKELLEKSFHYLPEFNIYDDFSPLFHPHNSENNHLLIEPKSKELIGHIGLWPRTLRLDQLNVPVHLVGGIAIDQRFQGKGLFKDFLFEVLEKYRQQTGLFILWSDLSQLYSQTGFFEVGTQIQTSDNTLSQTPKGFLKTSWEELSSSRQQRMQQIHHEFVTSKNKLIYLQRDNFTWSQLKEVRSSDLYLYTPKSDQIQGYFFINKGMDLQDIIHDYACVKEVETDFFTTLREYCLWAPEGLHQEIDKSPRKKLFICHIKPGDHRYFSLLISKMTNDKIQIKSYDDYNIQVKEMGEISHWDMEIFLRKIFGPSTTTETDQTKKYYHPIFIGGLESI